MTKLSTAPVTGRITEILLHLLRIGKDQLVHIKP